MALKSILSVPSRLGTQPLPPYSPDQIAALRTDPLARRMVRLNYGCSECGSRLMVYTALERDLQQEDQGRKWFAELPEEFQCSCGKMRFSLEYRRTGLHGVLGGNLTPADETTTTFIKLYETTKLKADCREFKTLLEADSPEQRLQDFLEKNLIFFSRFSALRLIPKPQIQRKYVADFAILNHRKELILIEIEKRT
jgi:hypothetical protein